MIAGIRIIQIYPNGNLSFHVQWEVDSNSAGAGPFNFTVKRSGSREGPFETVAENLGEVYTYTDTLDLLHGMDKSLYYQITEPAKSFESAPSSSELGLPRNRFLIRRKMIRDAAVMLKKGNGIQLQVIKKKHWGTRCPDCYEPKTGRLLLKNCETCFGTSFSGGYFTPISTLGIIRPTAVGTDGTADGSIPEVSTTNAMLQAHPIIKRGDIVVEVEVNNRWEVVSVQDTEILRNTVHQDITITRLPTSHIAYTLS